MNFTDEELRIIKKALMHYVDAVKQEMYVYKKDVPKNMDEKHTCDILLNIKLEHISL